MRNVVLFRSVEELVDVHLSWCLFAVGFGLALLGRALFQGVPSVDPLLPIVFLMASRFGLVQAMAFGGSAYFVSNGLVWGGHGWWDLPMVVGAVLVGLTGWFFKGRLRLLGILVATCLYELVVNLGFALVYGFATLPAAVPFVLVHLGSNLVFVGLGVKVLERMGVEKR